MTETRSVATVLLGRLDMLVAFGHARCLRHWIILFARPSILVENEFYYVSLMENVQTLRAA